MREEIRHIGSLTPLCGAKAYSNLRDDLPARRYKQLGVRERFKNEARYRICARCIRVIAARERSRGSVSDSAPA